MFNETEGELDLPFGMVSGALTPRTGRVDPAAEAAYRQALLGSIVKLEELRQKYVDRAIQTMSEDDKAVLVALTETMSAIAQGRIAAAMSLQGRAQAFQIVGKGVEDLFKRSLLVPDEQAMMDVQGYVSTFAGTAAAMGNNPDVRRDIATIVRNKGGWFTQGADGKQIPNQDAVSAVTNYIEDKGGGLNTVSNITNRLLKLDPGTRARTGMEAARLARAASQDGVKVLLSAIPETAGLSDQQKAQFADASGARLYDRTLADVGGDALKVMATEQETADATLMQVYGDIQRIGLDGISSEAAGEIQQVLKRAHDNYTSGRAGSAAVFNAVNANVPYFDDKIKQREQQLNALDNKSDTNRFRLADPIFAATDRMRARVPAFDVFQAAMRFPSAERAAVWSGRFPQALKLVNDAAVQNPSLLGDPAAVRNLLQRNGFPTTQVERAVWSFKPDQPLLPTDAVADRYADLQGSATPEPAPGSDAELEAKAEASPPMQGTATIEKEPATRQEAMEDLMTEGVPDLQGTATAEPAQAPAPTQPSPQDTFTGKAGTTYQRNSDGSYTVTKAASPILEGMTISREESPELWGAIAKEHNAAAMEAQPAVAEEAPPVQAAPPPQAPPPQVVAPLPTRAAPTVEEEADSVAKRKAALDALSGMPSKKQDDEEPKDGAAAEPPAEEGATTSDMRTGAEPPPLTSEDPAQAGMSTTQTPPATLAGYGAGRHADAALASAFLGRFRKPELRRG